MAGTSAALLIRAAGGVVWRERDGVLLVAVVHRSRYDDWSLPKGKLHDDETELAAAVREVREELGSEVAVSRRLTRISYPVGHARKRVGWWVMRHLAGEFVAGREVDAVEWLPAKAARARLTYAVERGVLSDLMSKPVPDSVVVLVRHARAGKRAEWDGEDALRPLDRIGHKQASRLNCFLAAFGPQQVVAADRVRCIDTVRPVAERVGYELVIDPRFSDEGFLAAPKESEQALLALARPGGVTVVCSQGQAVPGLLEPIVATPRPLETRKGGAWVLSFAGERVVSADYYPDAAR